MCHKKKTALAVSHVSWRTYITLNSYYQTSHVNSIRISLSVFTVYLIWHIYAIDFIQQIFHIKVNVNKDGWVSFLTSRFLP